MAKYESSASNNITTNKCNWKVFIVSVYFIKQSILPANILVEEALRKFIYILVLFLFMYCFFFLV